MADAAQLFTVPQAAKALEVSPTAVLKWIWGGRLRAARTGKGRGNGYKISRAEIARFRRIPRKPGRPYDGRIRKVAKPKPIGAPS